MSISASKQSLQIAKCNLSNFDENSVISFRIEILRHLNVLSTPFYTPNLVHFDFSIETSAANRKTQSFKFRRNSVILNRIEILRHIKAPSTPFYTPNVVHVDFSVEKIPADRKWQSFKFRRKLCYFVRDSETTAFKRSFHFILHAECSACRFQRRNNSCRSQNAIFQISTKTLSFRSRLRYSDV
jgi:hypothetical protein